MIWTDEINEKFLTKLIDELLTATRRNEKPKLILATDGGDAEVMAAAVEWLKQIPTNITATGYIKSAGVPILAAGNIRQAMPNTCFMYHPTSLGFEDTRLNSRKHLEYYEALDSRMVTELARLTAQPAAFWRRFNAATKYFGVDEALEWGLIDRVITRIIS